MQNFATTYLDFKDCVLMARMERKELDGIISYDKGLDKITDKRVEVLVYFFRKRKTLGERINLNS